MSYHHLSRTERERLSQMHAQGASQAQIAGELGRAPSTISRELRRNGEESGYSACEARRKAERRRRERPLQRKLDNPRLNQAVRHGLGRRWSPEEIAGRLPRERPDDPGLRLSHQTIYRWLEADRERLRQFRPLPAHRKRYRRRGRGENRGTIPNRTSIEKRPAAVEARSRYGDWEGDTIVGAGASGAILTCVERKSGYLVAAKMPDGTARSLNRSAERAFREVPVELRHTLTVDNGKEFAGHEQLSRRLGMPVYFAHAYSSNERATNENTNGLLRQYFPKGTDFRDVSHQALASAFEQINNQPRKRLDYRTPLEDLIQAGIVALEM